MNTTFIKQLKSCLPAQSWPWVIAALRQDELIWETIQTNDSFIQSPTEDDQHPESWNPARVAFQVLQQRVPPPNAALSLGLRQRAFRAYESITQHHQTVMAEAQPMVQAALLAVALRERLRLTGKWDDLSNELSLVSYDVWCTPLACLYGLIEKPLDLLHSLLTPGLSTDIHNLAIHTFLCNPLPLETQSNQLLMLIDNLRISEKDKILRRLATIRPSFAADIAQQINISPGNEASELPLDNLINQSHHADIALIAGNRTMAVQAINHAQENTRRIQANLAAINAQVSDTPLTSWQRAFELSPEEPIYRSRLALAYLETQNTAEANAILDPAEIEDQPELLYASARLAYLSGNNDRAQKLASQALALIETPSNDSLADYIISPSIILMLAESLLQFNLPSAASRAAKLALRERPDDPERLILFGRAQTAAGHHQRAAEAYQWAVLLAPQKIELHRELAKSLEAAGDWASALEERKIMAADPASSIDDQYALADNAIRNNQVAYATEICRSILAKDPTDGLAHTILGEAFIAAGDLPAGKDQFTKASELAPNLPRPWLALARAYQQYNQPDNALETLRVASQAIPGSAAVHHALGENYLAVNALTQALDAFQRAAEIEPQNIPVALRFGQTLFQLGHLPQAHQVLQQAYQREPFNTEVALTYAKILLGQDDPITAIPALETVVAANPHYPEPFVEYARALLLTCGDPTKATDAIRRALELDPKHVEATALLGDSLAAEKNYSASLQAYQTALDLPLAQDEALRARLSYGLGSVALHLGKIEIAITNLLEAVHLDPQNYRPHSQLVEAYQAAGLIPDAYQSANEALRLAPDDIHVMLWYVEKTLELAGTKLTLTNATTQQHPQQEEIRLHALQILKRAAEIAPAQADLLLRIAHIQCEARDSASAATSLRRIASIRYAPQAELQQAAQMLLNLDDASGAVMCYEKALSDEQEKSDNSSTRVALLSQLAYAYRQADNFQAALNIIDEAITLSPDNIDLCRDKAHILLELDQPKSAMNFLEDTITRIPDPKLHHSASSILKIQGKLVDALEHAEAGIHMPINQEKSEYALGQLECVIAAAELAKVTLQTERARQYLTDYADNIKQQNNTIYTNYHIISAEIALDSEDENGAVNIINTALKDNDAHSPRLQALQSRITARRGDYPTALALYQAALQSSGENEAGIPGSIKMPDENSSHSESHPKPVTSTSILYPLIDTAIELCLWGTALRLAQKAVQLAPAEPLAHLSLAHVLVTRAEYQRLCEDTELVGHAPGPVALSEGTCRTFDQAIQETLSLCESISQPLHTPALPHALERWQIRGNAVFTLAQDTVQALSIWAEHSPNPGDLAASISAHRRLSSFNDQQLGSSNQQSGVILTQIALSLADKNTVEAVKALQIAILNEPLHNTDNAIRHYLLARFSHILHLPAASSAIQTAITLLPDEPRWYALAAKITMSNGDKTAAINYLEKAIQLEPRYVEHHLALGKLYLQFSEENNLTEALQAVKSFEHACRLAPELAEAWLLLARAHRVTGNLDQAGAAAEQSTVLAQDSAASHLMQAEIALQSGKPDVAQDHAQTALHLQPDSQQAAMILSRALQALNRPAEALAVIDKAFPAAEQTLSLSIERIQLLRQSKGSEIALHTANELAQIYPDEPTVLAILAEVQADVGQDETAIRSAQKAILLGENLSTSQQASLRLLLGQLLRRAGQLDQAVHHLDEVIRLVPEKIDALLELGRTHQDRRQQTQALLMYRRAANIAPLDPRPYLQAGLALKEGKDYIEAESMLRRAADLAPNDPTIRRQLAAVIAINLVHNPRHSLQTETA